MIYFDNAATTGQKPQTVIQAVNNALKNFSVNPGRGGYSASKICAEQIYNCRRELADFFGAEDETGVIFTHNCTAALNMAIKGVASKGDHIITSSLEHNAVMRPLYQLKKQGVEVDIADVIFDDREATVRGFQKLIKSNTKLIVCTGASNVTGHILPIKEIGKIANERGVKFIVDAAQTAGVVRMDMAEMNIDYLCIAGHKGLYAPESIGVLIARKPIENTIIEGGTGTASYLYSQPDSMPERFESGTVAVPLIFGLRAGLDFVKSKGIKNIYKGEMSLAQSAYDRLSKIDGITLYSRRPEIDYTVPTLSFNLGFAESSAVAEQLGEMGTAVRAGLHCAPSAHSSIGTIERGTIRISFSAFNTFDEVLRFCEQVKRIKQKSGKI